MPPPAETAPGKRKADSEPHASDGSARDSKRARPSAVKVQMPREWVDEVWEFSCDDTADAMLKAIRDGLADDQFDVSGVLVKVFRKDSAENLVRIRGEKRPSICVSTCSITRMFALPL
jgi:hypothetical protein